MCCVQSKVHFV
ncbi:hypothetical protein ZEAMMB73_Zm00001d008311 [Zea mays]|uniref:Uncharacterized protein n=1 Tax=Zea mays TaxID=4577 RepID=A0A1D6FBS7_MAIZE|nr:hypothetical protein ZEAMMB73_Zm00001d008311 [Zea mays]